MIHRNAIKFLVEWKNREDRKPLILRGARQVGKTTLVTEFAKHFNIFLKLNLERKSDWELFEQQDDIQLLLQAIFVHQQQPIKNVPTLLFIDEIQHSKKAVAMLRYFYEDAKHIHVIAAGSLLESVMDQRKISFPVGRVEYMALRPCSFIEYMDGIDEKFDVELITELKATDAHQRVMRQFQNYTIVGGMPEAVTAFAKKRDILAARNVYESLLQSYNDDVEKYASNEVMIRAIRTILSKGWKHAAEPIAFERFGESNYRSREMSMAFQTIAKAMLMELVYPTSETRLPVLPNQRKRPKLIWLDTGLVNYVSDIQTEVFSVENIQDVWRGRIAEHIVAQELLALDRRVSATRSFWRRDEHGSEAEVDFVVPYYGKLIPIEVKSGHNSKLKSLHIFMDTTPHDVAVRVWSQPFSIDDVATPQGKKFRLINLPFYYVNMLEKILEKNI